MTELGTFVTRKEVLWVVFKRGQQEPSKCKKRNSQQSTIVN
jgi:hypothetical protein